MGFLLARQRALGTFWRGRLLTARFGPRRPVEAAAPPAPRPGVDARRAREAPQRGRAMSLPGGLAPSLRAPLPSGKSRMKKLPKRSQNEKYRLKYLRLRKAAKATVFVSLTPFGPSPRHSIRETFPQAALLPRAAARTQC